MIIVISLRPKFKEFYSISLLLTFFVVHHRVIPKFLSVLSTESITALNGCRSSHKVNDDCSCLITEKDHLNS